MASNYNITVSERWCMSGRGSRFISDRRVPSNSSWDDDDDWAAGSLSNLDVTEGGLVPKHTSNSIGIPDSVITQLNAKYLEGFSEGQPVLTWDDPASGVTFSGSGVYRNSAINGHPAVELNGDGDTFAGGIGAFSQPITAFVVFHMSSSDGYHWLFSSDRPGDSFQFGWNGEGWRVFAGVRLDGGEDHSINMASVVFDGVNSELQEEGRVTQSGDVGGADLEGLRIGYAGNADSYWDGLVGFLEIHEGAPSNGFGVRQQEIASAWGITLA